MTLQSTGMATIRDQGKITDLTTGMRAEPRIWFGVYDFATVTAIIKGTRGQFELGVAIWTFPKFEGFGKEFIVARTFRFFNTIDDPFLYAK